MRKFTFAKFNLPTKIFWWLLSSSGILVGGWTVAAAADFTAPQFAVLIVSLIIAWLINQHELNIKPTKTILTANCFTIFAGILLLGTAGGILLAATVSGVYYRRAPKDKTRWLLNSLIKITASFAAGYVFHLSFNSFAGATENLLAEKPIAFGWLLLPAIVLMSGVYNLSSALLNTVFTKLENNPADLFNPPKNNYRQTLQNSAFGIAAALVLHFALAEFGLSFGFVILLLTIAGNYAYFIHNFRLAQKTREIGEASRVHLAMVEALATAIDARDQVGIGHVQRTQIYAVGIGSILG